MTKEVTLKLRKILLVDDNPRVRSFVKPALEDAGFACLEAAQSFEKGEN